MIMEKIVCSFFVLLICCLTCNKNTVEPTPPQTEEEEVITEGKKYLALGDSYTIGEANFAEDKFPELLVERLRDDTIEMADPRVIAQTGWTTTKLSEAIEAAMIIDTFDLVSLLIGVNNQFTGLSLDDYEVAFEELLLQSIAFAGGDKDKVVVLSIPDYAYTEFGQMRDPDLISEEIDQFNAAKKTITENYAVLYIDITPISRMGLGDPSLVSDDNLHPSAEMYKLWVDLMYEDVKEKLE